MKETISCEKDHLIDQKIGREEERQAWKIDKGQETTSCEKDHLIVIRRKGGRKRQSKEAGKESMKDRNESSTGQASMKQRPL